MRAALLIALREFTENARTKGFWISVFSMPVVLFLAIQVPIWLEKKATPIRYFVIVDQSETLLPELDASMETAYQKDVLAALKAYARKHAPNAAKLLSQWDEQNPQSLQSFVKAGGVAPILPGLRPHLAAGARAFFPPRRHFQRVDLPPAVRADQDLDSIAEELKPYLLGHSQISFQERSVPLAAALLIPRNIQSAVRGTATQATPSGTEIQYWCVNASDQKLREQLERLINTEVRRREYVARGMDLAAVQQVEKTYAPVRSLNPKREKGKETMSAADTVRQWAPSAFVYLLWISLFVVVQMLLNNTIEEKSSRILEVLLSSVTPGELMMGKLAGIAAVGLTMVGIWIAALFVILSWKSGGPSEIAGQMLIILKGSNLLFLFALYYVLGYLVYAALILAIGSLCNSLKEAQSYMGVLTIILIVPMLTMTFIPKDPNGSLARVLSWIPLYTPFTMMNRAAADPPLVDAIGTLLLLIATAVVALYMAGRIFRIGILRTGQPPRMKELLQWLRQKDV